MSFAEPRSVELAQGWSPIGNSRDVSMETALNKWVQPQYGSADLDLDAELRPEHKLDASRAVVKPIYPATFSMRYL